jgi:hypothetical protein
MMQLLARVASNGAGRQSSVNAELQGFETSHSLFTRLFGPISRTRDESIGWWRP